MAWTDDDLIPISALEHYSYCPRQCGLIHLEQVWSENGSTTRGSLVHARVDELAHETRPDIRLEFGLSLWSDRLGLTGRADLVEFRPNEVYPVEYKVGRRRAWGHEAIQLCAQALCLEEMLGQPVPRGAIFYHGSRARREIECDDALRALVEETTAAVRGMLSAQQLPAPIADARCRSCSLRDDCLPDTVTRAGRERYWSKARFDPDLAEAKE
jgi:CRISPR-associated exonuclease Cas4